MQHRLHVSLMVLGLSLPVVLSARADVRLPAVMGSHMVLQRDQAVPIWGWADVAENVTVTCGRQRKTAEPGADGRWMVKLDPMPAGGPHRIAVEGKNQIQLEDVLVGEVWLCSGQSNMAMALADCRVMRQRLNKQRGIAPDPTRDGGPDPEVEQANYPQIRLFQVPFTYAQEPQKDCGTSWKVCAPDSAGSFSAIGYYFGRQIYRKLGVPVGLLNASRLGTPAEAWMSPSGIDAEPDVSKLVRRRWQDYVDHYPEARKKWDAAIGEYEQDAKLAKEKGLPAPHRPWKPYDPADTEQGPSRLFNGMIAPLVPYGIRGVLWCQGEGNMDTGYAYRFLFPALIRGWRTLWGQGEFPFFFVQSAGFNAVPVEPTDSSHSELRESQLLTLRSVPNTAMVVTLDIGESEVHYPNKLEVGRRLALAAMAMVYGAEGIVYSGPLYRAMAVEGDRIRITFDHVGGGLATDDGQPVKSLAIAGENRKFVWAKSRFENNNLLVWHPLVAKPVAVRYAWGENPPVNLFNKEGLPASPFRTDEWVGPTQYKWKHYTR